MLPPCFAYDTETDQDPDITDYIARRDATRTCCVQVCDVDATSLDDVILFIGEDAIEQFIHCFEATTYATDCHMYNLSNYEMDWLKKALVHLGYRFVMGDKDDKLVNGTFTIKGDRTGVYKCLIRGFSGYLMTITDDMKRFGSHSMKEVANMIRADHPDWFSCCTDVKLHIEYNNGWFYKGTDRDKVLEYSKQDAYSQAMIARYVTHDEYSQGLGNFLTAQSWAMMVMLFLRYHKDLSDISDPKTRRYVQMNFKQDYPPLERDMQDIVEESLLGGFVWGAPGIHHGTFCHIDYKSSYPYEYAYGSMFKGKVRRVTPDDPNYRTVRNNRRYFKWIYCSFDFKLKEGHLPAFTGKELGYMDQSSAKARSGHIDHRLFTESYLAQVGRTHDLHNIKIHEVWYALRFKGGFKDTTEYFYSKKESAPKKSLELALSKLGLNGAQHGKTITKTNRDKRIVDDNGDYQYIPEVSDPDYLALIGFTGMMNARERLMREAEMLIDAGHHILMCDTDSIVVDSDIDTVMDIIGHDRFIDPYVTLTDKSMENTLGKFEFESYDYRYGNGTVYDRSYIFHTFKCWGMKKYVEIAGNNFYRKSAFAGMHDDIQKDVLMSMGMEGCVYEQSNKVRCERGVTIEPHFRKLARMVDQWVIHPDEIDRAIHSRKQQLYGDIEEDD